MLFSSKFVFVKEMSEEKRPTTGSSLEGSTSEQQQVSFPLDSGHSMWWEASDGRRRHERNIQEKNVPREEWGAKQEKEEEEIVLHGRHRCFFWTTTKKTLSVKSPRELVSRLLVVRATWLSFVRKEEKETSMRKKSVRRRKREGRYDW